MKNFVQLISAGLFCVIALACNNDFLSKTPEEVSSLTTTSEILISPDWEAKDYSIHVPMAGDADFRVTKTPGWFKVQTSSGQFTNDMATIRCNALVNNDFSEIGIYASSMVLNIEGSGKIIVPVSYITEGDPYLQCSANQLDFGQTDITRSLDISNQGPGLLIWEIDSCPDWLSVSETGGIFPPYSSKTLLFTCDRSLFSNEQQSQTIYLRTNDKNNPLCAIEVAASNDIDNSTIFQVIDGTVIDAWSIEKIPTVK